LPEVRLLVARVLTTTLRPLATFDAPSGMRPLAPGYSRWKGWTANRLPTSRPRLPMLFRSFTGSSASSIDVSDATNDAGPLPASVLDLDRRCRGGLSHLRDPNSGEPSLAGLLSAVQ
jgi:hypothetical protein